MDSGVKSCQFCPFKAPDLKHFLKHIRQVHAHKPGFQIVCNLSGCPRKFRKFEVFRNHVYGFHTDEEAIIAQVPSPLAEDEEETSSESVGIGAEGPPVDKEKIAAATWILKVQELYKLPQSTMDCILRDTTGFIQDLFLDVFDSVKSCLTEAGVDSHHIEGLSGLFDSSSHLANPFAGLENQYLQLNFYKKAFNFREPHPILLGLDKQWKGSGAKRTYREVREEMIYIPVLDTIQDLLNDDEVLKQINEGHTSTDSVIRDYCDGTYYSEHPLSANDSHFLQLFIYYDDVEVCNPLGSKKIIHKLGVFYFVLGNTSTKFRSKVKRIYLFALVSCEILKKYGMNAILKPLIDDVKKLEAGFTFVINGVPQTKYGTICLVLADNLASNAMGGFKEGSTAHRGCRQCLSTLPEIASVFIESLTTLRTTADHSQKCRQMDLASTKQERDQLSTEYGINHSSILNELLYFDLCSGALVQDVMHDVLEGMLEYETKELLICHIQQESYYTLEYLNQQIAGLELGYMESSDRPSLISYNTLHAYSTDHKLRQEAAQMWLLGRLLPLMVGDKVPAGDDFWLNYMDLLNIVDLLLAPELTEDDVAHLSVLIEDHHLEFVRLYPHASVTPKMHYLIHMPRLILKFGPIRHHWTMRFEAKHSYFKKLTQNIGNFINLPYTLSIRHQKLLCYFTMDKHNYRSNNMSIGPGMSISPAIAPSGLPVDADILRLKWINLDGTLYKKPCALVLRNGDYSDDFPTFGKLLDIYVVNSKVYFEIQEYATLEFDSHFHCFHVRLTTIKKVVATDHLFSYYPHQVRLLPGCVATHCIVPKHHFYVL